MTDHDEIGVILPSRNRPRDGQPQSSPRHGLCRRSLLLTIYAAPIHNAFAHVQEHRTHPCSMQVLPAQLLPNFPTESRVCWQCSGPTEKPFLILAIRHSPQEFFEISLALLPVIIPPRHSAVIADCSENVR